MAAKFFRRPPVDQPGRLAVEDRAGLRWLKPTLVAQIAFPEWTRDASLRHSRFVAMRQDPKKVVRE
jgi:bifunctional non-homologous end joining protein LigD